MRSLDTRLRLARLREQAVVVKEYEQGQPKFMEVIVAFVALAVLGGVAWLCILGLLVNPEILEGLAIIGGLSLLTLLALWLIMAVGKGRA